jgi:xanthine dehydrogenase accessory factor
MKELVSDILEHLNRNEAVGIAVIVAHQGSSPRSTGAKMILHEDGSISGSIGGGILEARVMDEARSLFQNKRLPGLLFYDLTPGDLDTMGMTCGGKVTILLDLVLPTEQNRKIFLQWQTAIKNRQGCFLLTRIPHNHEAPKNTRRCILDSQGIIYGKIPLSPKEEKQLHEKTNTLKTPEVMDLEGALFLVEPSIPPKTLHIFGAGHVAVPTADLAARVGFEVYVLDDREAFASSERFSGAVKPMAVASFEEVFSGITLGRDDFIVIVTRGHLHDKTVLDKALKTQAGYIGMIGSRKKRDAIYTTLLEEGFSQKDLDRVHCPIGLSIGAETPEEIAVSIVAELITVRTDSKP